VSKPDDDFYVLSIRFAEEPQWDEWVSAVGTRETVSQQFDLDNLPPGAALRKGAEARRWLASAAKAEEKVARFLHAKLNPILTKFGCAAIIVHHTPKTNFTRLENMQWYDWMYAMSGCASLTNWARAVLVLAPSKVPGTYRLIAAKRFEEIGWTEREYWLSHSKDTIRTRTVGSSRGWWSSALSGCEEVRPSLQAHRTR
jgi:hypothetical protein